LNAESIFKIPARQNPQSAFGVVLPLFLRRALVRLEFRDFFDPNINTGHLREIKARHKKYLISAARMLKKDKFVLLWALIM